MAAIPGVRFDITGASGSQGLLSPQSSWRAFILPRGGYAAQDSSGTLLTFDSAAVASRFVANNWIQAGLSVDNIRQVSAVGGDSISVSGANLTVSENDRIFVIGNTEPSVVGGSATYTTPNTIIRERDDDAADLYTNSMVTSDANGLIEFYSNRAIYDCIIQDGNQTNQGSLRDLQAGTLSTSTKYASDYLPGSSTAGIQEAIDDLPTNGGTVYVAAGTHDITASISITTNNVRLIGAGPASTLIRSNLAAGDAIKVDLSGVTLGNEAVFTLENVGLTQITNALDGTAALVNISNAARFVLRNVSFVSSITSDFVSSGTALSVTDINMAWIHDLFIIGYSAGGRWAIGVDLCNGISANRGNISFFGGKMKGVIKGVDIANGASVLVNNIQFYGTKFVLDGTSAQTVGIGVHARAQAQNIIFSGVHFESYNNCVTLDSATNVSFDACLFSKFSAGTTPIAIKMINICDCVTVNNCFFGAGTTGISLDASAHSQIRLANIRQSTVTTMIDDNSSSGALIETHTSGDGIGFVFKDANFHLIESRLELEKASTPDMRWELIGDTDYWEARWSAAAGGADSGWQLRYGDVGGTTNSIICNAGAGDISLHSQGIVSIRADGNPSTNETGMSVLVNDGGSPDLRKVEIGAADSGGSGYRMLRVVN